MIHAEVHTDVAVANTAQMSQVRDEANRKSVSWFLAGIASSLASTCLKRIEKPLLVLTAVFTAAGTYYALKGAWCKS